MYLEVVMEEAVYQDGSRSMRPSNTYNVWEDSAVHNPQKVLQELGYDQGTTWVSRDTSCSSSW